MRIHGEGARGGGTGQPGEYGPVVLYPPAAAPYLALHRQFHPHLLEGSGDVIVHQFIGVGPGRMRPPGRRLYMFQGAIRGKFFRRRVLRKWPGRQGHPPRKHRNDRRCKKTRAARRPFSRDSVTMMVSFTLHYKELPVGHRLYSSSY